MQDRRDHQQQILASPFFDGLPGEAIEQAVAKVVMIILPIKASCSKMTGVARFTLC
jgi:hypothetical protein